MIWISNAAGSRTGGHDRRTGELKEFQPMFAQYKIETELADLSVMPCGDFFFTGNGPGGNVNVGIERKTVREILDDTRFASEDGQLDAMLRVYDYCFLVVEGGYRCDIASGVLQVYRSGEWRDLQIGTRRFMHTELQRRLIMLSLTPVRIWQTRREEDTVRLIADVYHQLARKQWDEHKSIGSVQAAVVQEPVLLRKRTREEENENYRRRVALCSTHVGQDKCRVIAARFPSAREFMNATVEELCEIDGIGQKSAEAIVREITNAAG